MKTFAYAFRLISTLCIAFVLSISIARSTSIAADHVVTFGAALPLTGAMSAEGNLVREGYAFWATYVNAHGGIRIGTTPYRVAIKYDDDESNPAKNATLTRALIEQDHVNFVLGPFGTADVVAAAPVVEAAGVPMVEATGTSEKIFNQGYKQIFLIGSPARKYLAGLIEMAVRRQPKISSACILAENNPFTLEIQQGAVELANDHLIRVVCAPRYDSDTSDFTSVVQTVKTAHPDMILVASYVKTATAIEKALRDQDVPAKIYAYTVGPDVPAFRETFGRAADFLYGPAQWSAAVKYVGAPGFYRTPTEYARAFEAVYHHVPAYQNAGASATGLVYQYALEKTGSLDRRKVRDTIAKMDLVTFYGLVKFDSRGVNMWKPMVVNQVQKGRLVTVYPYRLAEGAPAYPTPDWSSR